MGLLVVLATAFSASPKNAFAATQLIVTIDPSGYVTYPAYSTLGTITLLGTHQGTYPGGALITSSCTLGCSNTVLSGLGTMEGGFLNGAGSTPDGDYWVDVTSSTAGSVYFVATRSSGVWSTSSYPSADQTERIISFSPATGSTTVSTSVFVEATVWNESSSAVRFTFQNFDFNGSILPVVLTLPAVSGQVSTSTTVTLGKGFYLGTVQMLRDDGSVVDSRSFSFTVVESAIENYSSFATSTNIASTTLPTCSGSTTTGLLGSLYNFGCFLVVPSPAAIAQFGTLADSIKTRIPFVYFYQIRDIVASSSASAASSTLGSFTLSIGTTTDPIHINAVLFSPATIRYFIPDFLASAFQTVALASLWLGFAWYLYHRGRNLLAEKTK